MRVTWHFEWKVLYQHRPIINRCTARRILNVTNHFQWIILYQHRPIINRCTARRILNITNHLQWNILYQHRPIINRCTARRIPIVTNHFQWIYSVPTKSFDNHAVQYSKGPTDTVILIATHSTHTVCLAKQLISAKIKTPCHYTKKCICLHST
jgi:hypothetical protein